MSACKSVNGAELYAVVSMARESNERMVNWGYPDRAWMGWVIVNNERPQGFTAAGLSTYKATAWDEPATPPVLPWAAPVGHPVGRVELDGTYAVLCVACQPGR